MWRTPFLSRVYTSGFRMHFPHCVAISYYLPWFSSIKVSNINRMCKRTFNRQKLFEWIFIKIPAICVPLSIYVASSRYQLNAFEVFSFAITVFAEKRYWDTQKTAEKRILCSFCSYTPREIVTDFKDLHHHHHRHVNTETDLKEKKASLKGLESILSNFFLQ